jgi:hypothetical protein
VGGSGGNQQSGDGTVNADLIKAMNANLSKLIAKEVGDDDGSFLPIRDGKWFFPPKSER